MDPNLMAEMARLGVTRKALAELLGISERTAGEKLRGEADFKISEMFKIKMRLGKTLDYLFSTGETEQAI